MWCWCPKEQKHCRRMFHFGKSRTRTTWNCFIWHLHTTSLIKSSLVSSITFLYMSECWDSAKKTVAFDSRLLGNHHATCHLFSAIFISFYLFKILCFSACDKWNKLFRVSYSYVAQTKQSAFVYFLFHFSALLNGISVFKIVDNTHQSRFRKGIGVTKVKCWRDKASMGVIHNVLSA